MAVPVKAEKNVPIPPRSSARYPYATMKVGESFLYPASVSSSCRQMASNAGRKYGRKFRVSATEEGMRCWRVE